MLNPKKLTNLEQFVIIKKQPNEKGRKIITLPVAGYAVGFSGDRSWFLIKDFKMFNGNSAIYIN